MERKCKRSRLERIKRKQSLRRKERLRRKLKRKSRRRKQGTGVGNGGHTLSCPTSCPPLPLVLKSSQGR